MTDAYERRITRSLDLAEKPAQDLATAQILLFYIRLLKFQNGVYACVRDNNQTALEDLLPHFPPLLELIHRDAPEALSNQARQLTAVDQRLALLEACWGAPSGDAPGMGESWRFFARALLQPYAEYLATRGAPDVERTSNTCPFCGARPVVGVLRGEGEGARRSLICSLCATEWRYRRVLCPNCGEQDNARLPVYTFEQFGHVRVEACDTCHVWIKTFDLTKDGHAVPAADDMASAPVTIWAASHDYQRIETNALGM